VPGKAQTAAIPRYREDLQRGMALILGGFVQRTSGTRH